MIRKRGVRRTVVFSLLAAMFLPMGVYAQTDGGISLTVGAQEESLIPAGTGAQEESAIPADTAVQEESAEISADAGTQEESAGNSSDTAVQEEAPAGAPESGAYGGTVSSSDSAGFESDAEDVSAVLLQEDDFDEELVGAIDGIEYYLPYENAKYYLSYQIMDTGEIRINRCILNEDSTAEVCGDIVIPDEIDGHPVTIIQGSAFTPEYVGQFYGTLTLPKGLKSIGGHAFQRQSGLTGDLIIPEGVTSIGMEAFRDCTGFTGRLVLPKEMTKIERYTFRNCGFTGSLTFPDGLTEIENYAFEGCSGLTGDLHLPEGLVSIASDAFWKCSGFNGTLILPDSLTNIGWGAFNGCSGLVGDLDLPENLTSLGSKAFMDCSSLDGSLILPKGLETVKSATFWNCPEILNVSIPASVTGIEDDAFHNCYGLTHVYYEGGNWAAVTTGTGNEYLGNANLHCNSYYTVDTMPPAYVPGGNENPVAVIRPSGASTPASTYQYDSQAYSVWSDNVTSYLYDNGNGLTRVEYYDGAVIIENYDASFQYQSGWTLEPELPLWGGFYAGEKYNFLIFGQNNPNEDDSVEVIRVVKYDKAWNRLGHASLRGANTTVPFEAGSLRCDEYGGMLYIHTCHEMYASRDGKNHQANLTFSLREIDMWLTDRRTDILNPSYGYVSHSFNQFLLVDRDGYIVTLDHGDGLPRAAMLARYEKKAGKNSFMTMHIPYVNLFMFPGAYGDNVTNASVGGLAETGSGYIAAYNYSPSGESWLRDIYISYMPKDSFVKESAVTWTNPAATGTTPVIASLGNEGGYVLWRNSMEREGVCYVRYDAQGNISQIQTCDNALLSDCQPILYRGNLVWYASGEDGMTFYALNGGGISAYDPTDPSSVPLDPEQLEQLRSFVRRLYTVCLGREYDKDGLDYWVNYLSSHTKTAAEVAWGFFFSDEFINKGYSEQEYLDILYRTMFDREEGTEERNYWMERFENGMSRLFVYRGFAESVEFSNLCGRFGVIRGSVELTAYRDRNEGATGFIARLYTRMLGRTYEEEGLEYWCRAYLTGEKTIEDIASDGFLHSPELLNMNLPDEEFVARMYRTFLNREPEADGLAYWVDRLQTGQENRDTLVYGFTRSPEFAELKASYGL